MRVVMVRRATLHGALLDAVAAEPRIARCFGVELERASRDGTVILHEGHATREEHADVVVGADGVHSRVRDGGRFDARVRRTGIRYVRTLVGEGLGEGVEAWTSAGLFGSFAVDGGTYVFASCGTRETSAALDARNLDAFRTAWAIAYEPSRRVLGDVRQFDDLLVNEVVSVTCRRWHDGRLALLGDAAHAMAPNLGQGANSALVDAAVLLDALRREGSVEAALGAYEHRRRARVARVALMSARLGTLAEASHPVARALRDRVLVPVLSRLASPAAAAQILQEPPDVLRAIGRA
jgi:2-polyprenyl-6-methoxyphenol hydroxylase-like FAD-dependent oxidoreductase